MSKEWEHVVVLGAAGKMGSGIALLLLQEMAGIKGSMLTLLDANPLAFASLRHYLHEHLLKFAERNINRLRAYYQNDETLVDNGEMIQAFVEEGLGRVRLVTSIEECRGARMVFEAILEDEEIKTDVLSRLDAITDPEAVYFSNTSSIPIRVLEENSKIHGRLIGLHFYNPPAVQKLLEVIVPIGVNKHTLSIALDVAKRLGKTVIYSEDIAGFIGNGHFIREISEGCSRVEKLRAKMPLREAICTVNTITQDFLIRPMGLFQLMDYVGLDVVRHIARVMSSYLSGEVFNTSLIDEMLQQGIKGGQHADGTQKDGFFSYEKGHPEKVYDMETRQYVPYISIEEERELPLGHESWKVMVKDKARKEKLSGYFTHLRHDPSKHAKMAVQFLEGSRTIAHGLVKAGVARSIEDVDVVLQNGFFHLYNVDDPWKAVGVKK